LKSDQWVLLLDDGLLSFWMPAGSSAESSMSAWHLSDSEIMQSGIGHELAATTLAKRYIKYTATAQFGVDEKTAREYLERADAIMRKHREVREILANIRFGGKGIPHSRAVLNPGF